MRWQLLWASAASQKSDRSALIHWHAYRDDELANLMLQAFRRGYVSQHGLRTYRLHDVLVTLTSPSEVRQTLQGDRDDVPMQVTLGPEDKYLVFCSDGISEFMDSDHILAIIHYQARRGWRPSDIAKYLVCLDTHMHIVSGRLLPFTSVEV